MIGDLYIYSDTFNGDTNIIDLSPNNFTINKTGNPYHSTSYTSVTPKANSSIFMSRGSNFLGNTGIILGENVDFTFDIYLHFITNNVTYLPVIRFGMIGIANYNYNTFQIINLNNNNIIFNMNMNTITNTPSFFLLTITRQNSVMKLYINGIFGTILSNFDIGTSFFGVYNTASEFPSSYYFVVNTVRIINGTCLYNTDFSIPTFPYTDGESITGQVTENDIGVIRTIRLYNRNNGLLTYTTISNADGSYEIPILNNDVEYDIVFLDDTAGYTYNDIIKRTSLI